MESKVPLILLVDDEPNFLEILSVKLGAAGYKIETVESGDVALKKAKELKPDIILLDVKMPIKNGIETVAEMRQDAELKNAKVVFLTSYGDLRPGTVETDEKFAREIGALGYIRKTDDLDAITDKIRSFLK